MIIVSQHMANMSYFQLHAKGDWNRLFQGDSGSGTE